MELRTGSGGSRRDRTESLERLCALSRQCRPADELIRFVVSPDNILTPDLDRRLPGRGVWVTATRASIAQAVKARVFQRSLKKNVQVRDDLADQVEQLLISRLMQTLSLANKAGLVMTGFSKVKAAIDCEDIVALIHASDGAENGADRLNRKFQAVRTAKDEYAQIVACLTSAQLSLALGRENVVHAGLVNGGLAARFLAAADHYTRFGAGFDEKLAVKKPI